MIKEKKILPASWERHKLGEVCDVLTGTTPPKSDISNYGNDVPFFKPPHLWDGQINDTVEKLSFKGAKKARIVPPNTVLVTCIGNLGRTGLVKKSAAFNQQINAILCKEQTNFKFIFYQAQSPLFKRQLEALATGTTVSIVNKGNFEKIEILLPPYKIQINIVSKIEELFSELDKSIENLRIAQQQLTTYRQSVLKYAFGGRLTNNSLNEGELPQGWHCVNFGTLFSENPQNGLYKPSNEYGSGTPIIRIDGFYDGIILDNYQYKRVRLSNEEINKYSISVGDILVNRVNSMPYLGKCGIVKFLKEKTVFESNIMKVRIKKEMALPEYLAFYLSSQKGIHELRKNAKQAVNQASINQSDVSNVIIPVAPIDEQHIIVQAIESRLSVADKMEETIIQSLKQSEALRQSILRQAFVGKLI